MAWFCAWGLLGPHRVLGSLGLLELLGLLGLLGASGMPTLLKL